MRTLCERYESEFRNISECVFISGGYVLRRKYDSNAGELASRFKGFIEQVMVSLGELLSRWWSYWVLFDPHHRLRHELGSVFICTDPRSCPHRDGGIAWVWGTRTQILKGERGRCIDIEWRLLPPLKSGIDMWDMCLYLKIIEIVAVFNQKNSEWADVTWTPNHACFDVDIKSTSMK